MIKLKSVVWVKKMIVDFVDKVYSLDFDCDDELKIKEYSVHDATIYRRKKTRELVVLYSTEEGFLFFADDIGKSVFFDEESAKKVLLG